MLSILATKVKPWTLGRKCEKTCSFGKLMELDKENMPFFCLTMNFHLFMTPYIKGRKSLFDNNIEKMIWSVNSLRRTLKEESGWVGSFSLSYLLNKTGKYSEKKLQKISQKVLHKNWNCSLQGFFFDIFLNRKQTFVFQMYLCFLQINLRLWTYSPRL